jgi:EAL domain-containing protein (putative c-di-GMP-specific phosphodiesterase class I)
LSFGISQKSISAHSRFAAPRHCYAQGTRNTGSCLPPISSRRPTTRSTNHYPNSSSAARIADWQRFAEAGLPLKLAVNMPVSAINAPDFISFVRERLSPDPRFRGLIIEITEDEMINDPARIREISTQLKLYNVWISIDDFGAAYSSLSRLLDLPCIELKLDRTFVANCSADRLKYALCQTVIDLAHRFGCLVCAEGVENADDLQAIIQMGCDTGQGYFFSRPLAPDDFVKRVIVESLDFPARFNASTASAAARAGHR